MDVKLSKSTVLMECIQRTVIVDEVWYGIVDEDNPIRYTHTMAIPIQSFLDMGNPTQLTVTIEPGDKLNNEIVKE